MRYKKNFIALLLKEEKMLIEYIVKAYASINSLNDAQRALLDRALFVIADNKEFTRATFKKLLDLFYFKLHLPPIEFNKDKDGGYRWGPRYQIPSDREKAAKMLHNRRNKRRMYIDEAWYMEFDESFDWESLEDKEHTKQTAKEAIKATLGKGRIDEIREGRDPGSAVIVPFSKKES